MHRIQYIIHNHTCITIYNRGKRFAYYGYIHALLISNTKVYFKLDKETPPHPPPFPLYI